MDLFGDLPPPLKEDAHKPSTPLVCRGKKSLKRKSTGCNVDKQENINKKVNSNSNIIGLYSYIGERKGERDEMQDTATLINDCTNEYSESDRISNSGISINRISFFGVYDGHGGKRASEHLKENLHENIRKHFHNDNSENFDKELKKCLVQAFKVTDEEFLNKASRESPHWRDGSTASCVLVVNNTVYAANVGDTKTLLIRKDGSGKSKIVSLSKDHSPTLYDERQRVQNAGGFIRDGRVQGVLEVSRAIGDARFKKYVISTPEIVKVVLTDTDRYILIACDGLWKGFSVTEVVEYIDHIFSKSNAVDRDELYEYTCKEIANEAIRRGSSDNVTVVLICIGSFLR